MADSPISGLPAITVPNNSYLVAAVSASVTSKMTLAEIAAAISSSFTASQAISASYVVSASYAATASTVTSASYATTASYAVSASYAPDNTFPYTGSAIISGSLILTGSLSTSGTINNTVVGIGAGTDTTSTAVGNQTLATSTTGHGNTAIGSSTMRKMTTGYDNVAVGYQTLEFSETGAENTVIGNVSLNSLTNGSTNTVVGFNMGSAITSGSNNTLIGGQYTGTSTLNNTIILADGAGNVGFKYSGSRAEITGSLNVTGSISQTFVTSSLVKANASGQLVAATAGQDYTPTSYLSAYHTASLTVTAANTPCTMSFSTTDFSYNGITISGSWSDKIKIDTAGVYNIQFSAQTNKTTGTSSTLNIWLAKNGTEVPYSNTGVTMAGGANDVAIPAWNFYVSASAGDYYQLLFSATQTNTLIQYLPSGSAQSAGPAVPSVILTVNRIA